MRNDAESPERESHVVEKWIATLLWLGVYASFTFVVVGAALTFVHHPEYEFESTGVAHLIQREAVPPHTLAEVITGVLHLRGQAVIALGLMILIATPVARVAASLVGFAIERDWRYVVITSIVLVLLVISAALGIGER